MVQRSMSQIKVYKNILSNQDYKHILSEIESREVAWYKGAVLYDESQAQFSHTIYIDHNVTSQLFDLFSPLYKKMDIKLFHRIRLNCNLQKNEQKILGGMHNDFYNSDGKPVKEVMIGIYYANNTNGKTLIEEDGNTIEIENEANSLVVFPNILRHTGTTHTDAQFRYVLNINYI